jgi:hypothetical protein
MIAPPQYYSSERQLRQALDDHYKPYAANMEFRVESPPRKAFGAFDYYIVRTGMDGRVNYVSIIFRTPRGGA